MAVVVPVDRHSQVFSLQGVRLIFEAVCGRVEEMGRKLIGRKACKVGRCRIDGSGGGRRYRRRFWVDIVSLTGLGIKEVCPAVMVASDDLP